MYMYFLLPNLRHLARGSFQTTRPWISNHSKLPKAERLVDIWSAGVWWWCSPHAVCLLAYQRQHCISQTERERDGKNRNNHLSCKNIVLSGCFSPHNNTFTLHNTNNKTLHKRWANEWNLPRLSTELLFVLRLSSLHHHCYPTSFRVPGTVRIHGRRKGKFAAEVIQLQRSPWTILHSVNSFQSDVKLSVSA